MGDIERVYGHEVGKDEGVRVTEYVRLTYTVGLSVAVTGRLVAIAEGDPVYLPVKDTREAEGVRVTGDRLIIALMVSVTDTEVVSVIPVGVT